MTALPDSDLVSDAELTLAAAAGDQTAFAGIYDRYADRLFDFCVGMVRDRDTAADCVQDAFCTAATRLASLRDPDKLRPWLYAIARNEALRRIRERRREQPSDDLPDTSSSEPGPDTLAARSELAELVAQAAGGLSDRDRTVLELTYRHGMDGPELAEALGVSAASARTLTHRLRETVERSLGALLVVRSARNGRGCAELAASMKDWDGEFTVLTRKRVARHIDSCLVCEESRRKMVNPTALLGGAPLFIAAPPGLRKRTLDRIQLVCAQSALTGAVSAGAAGGGSDSPAGTDQDAPGATGVGLASAVAPLAPLAETGDHDGDAPDHDSGDDDEKRRRRVLLLFLLLAVAMIAALWLALAWPFAKQAPLAPAGVTQTSSPPSPAPSAAPTTPPAPPTTTSAPAATSSAPASPPPVYRKPNPQTYSPPTPDPGGADVPASPEPTIPIIRPTPPRPTAPLFPVPRATTPGSSGIGHKGSTGTGSTGTGSTGTGSTGAGSTGTGSTGKGSTGTGSTGTGGSTTGGTSDPSGGPVR